MPQCEAEQRNLQAAFEIELQWGAGKIDLGRIKNILSGPDTTDCTDHPNDNKPESPKPRHRLTENHNADPVCTCGWDPARLLLGIHDRETAREAIRDHILERGAQ